MIFRVPDYYEDFSCIADKCQHSCCIGWEIDIDEDTYNYYQTVGGEIGEKIRSQLFDKGDGEHGFRLGKHERCPFLNEKNLCDICIELGEEAFSEVCTEYPRVSLTYMDVLQKAISLSCEENGRLVFTREEPVQILEFDYPDYGDYEEVESEEWCHTMEELQKKLISILQDRTKSIEERMWIYLKGLCDLVKKEEITEEDLDIFNNLKADLTNNRRLFSDFSERFLPFTEMEMLNEEWINLNKDLEETFNEESYPRLLEAFLSSSAYREIDYEQLMVYFTFRYFMNSVYDMDIITYGKMAVVFTLVIRDMNALTYAKKGSFDRLDCIDDARKFSREVEHSEGNEDLAKDAMLFDDVYKEERLLLQI